MIIGVEVGVEIRAEVGKKGGGRGGGTKATRSISPRQVSFLSLTTKAQKPTEL